MRRFFAVASILSQGRTVRLYLWPILTSVCAYVIALSIFVPLFGSIERGNAPEQTPPMAPSPTAAEQPQGSPPNFSIAVGTDDEAREMPAIQSAMTDYLSFSDEFFTRLEQGAVAPDFSTSERELTPESARAQVEDGTSVLAVVLPKKLTPQIIDDIRAYYRGDIDAPRYTLTILASPQALYEDEFVLNQYRDQVIRQAEEHVSEQIRIVAQRFGCEFNAQQECPRTQDQAELAFERPFDITVEEVDGPTPVDYFSGGTDTAGASSAGAPSAGAPSAGPAGNHQQTETSATSASATLSAIIGAIVLAAITLALFSSAAVNRAAGLHLLIVGPWRSMSPQRPFPRRTLLIQKYGIAAAGTVLLSAVAAAHPGVQTIAAIGFLCLVCLTVVITILAATDTVGGLFGAVVALGTLVWSTAGSFVPTLLDPGHPDLWAYTSMLIGFNRQTFVELGPTVVVLLVLLAAAFLGGLAATGIFDRKFSTAIHRGTP